MRFLSDGKGSQARILTILARHQGTISQRELIQSLGIQPGSASKVLGKLEHAGWIQRKPSVEDHRAVTIFITPSGREEAKAVEKRREAREKEMFLCLSKEEKETLLGLLEKIRQDWQERYPATQRKGHRH